MTALKAQDIRNLAHDVGFRGNDEVIATAIALAESKGETTAISPPNADGTQDYGLWQINSSHFNKLSLGSFGLGVIYVTRDNVLQPDTNAKAAYALYAGRGNSFGDWTTYKDGTYKSFMAQATETSQPSGLGQGVKDFGNTGDPSTAASAAANATGIPGLMSWLGKELPIVGWASLAVILLILGVILLIAQTKAGKTAGKVAKKAAEGAALL